MGRRISRPLPPNVQPNGFIKTVKLLSYGLQGDDPWAKVELSHDDVQRLLLFLQTTPSAAKVGDLRRQFAELEQKLQLVRTPAGRRQTSPWEPLPYTGALRRPPVEESIPDEPQKESGNWPTAADW
jgi:hypothetical protein